MKPHQPLLALAAALALPVFAWAADNTPNLDSKFSGESTDVPAVPPSDQPALAGSEQSNSSGIFLHHGQAWILHRLQGEISLPNGMKVEPNGTLLGNDGKNREMGSGQMLTLDGQIKAAPFSGGSTGLGTPAGAKGAAPFDDKKADPGTTSPEKFFSPASGSFPGVSDTFGTGTSSEQQDDSEFTD